MRVFRTRVDLQLLPQCLFSKTGLGEHSENSLFDDTFGVLLEQVCDRRKPLVPHKTGVPEVLLLLEFLARKPHLFGIDDNNEVTAVHMRREGCFVFSSNELSNFAGQAPKHLPLGIYEMPTMVQLT